VTRFIVTRGPGPAWDPAKPIRGQAGWEPHADFMDGLSAEGFVAFGGPVDERMKVVLVVDAPDEGTIRSRLAADPWSTAELARIVAIDEWRVWLGGDERVDPARLLYLVAYAPGPEWDATRPRREQDGWEAHAEFIDALVDDGVVVIGGPLDGQRALLVMQHDAEAALRALIARDPWVGGVLTIEEVERWALWLPPRTVSRA
jgi:uncharacterized protein